MLDGFPDAVDHAFGFDSLQGFCTALKLFDLLLNLFVGLCHEFVTIKLR